MLGPRGRGGFTLIELMITLVIVGVVLALGLPGIMEWMQNSQIRTAAEGIQNGLQAARTEAVRRNSAVEFILTSPATTGGTGWTIRNLNDGAVIQSAPDGVGSRNVVLTPTPAGATTVTFNGFGRVPTAPVVTNADGSPFLTSIDLDNSQLTASSSRDLRIVISGGGEVRMCDPNVSDTLDPRRCGP
jgi:type IV fimbrial biogenesis protein FimT